VHRAVPTAGHRGGVPGPEGQPELPDVAAATGGHRGPDRRRPAVLQRQRPGADRPGRVVPLERRGRNVPRGTCGVLRGQRSHRPGRPAGGLLRPGHRRTGAGAGASRGCPAGAAQPAADRRAAPPPAAAVPRPGVSLPFRAVTFGRILSVSPRTLGYEHSITGGVAGPTGPARPAGEHQRRDHRPEDRRSAALRRQHLRERRAGQLPPPVPVPTSMATTPLTGWGRTTGRWSSPRVTAWTPITPGSGPAMPRTGPAR